ncbi:MAG: TfoX/Sxy family protein [Nitrospirota bacterium]
MPVSAEFRDYVLAQLACLGHVTGRPMFGGVGIYLDGVFFALIADDVVYFKVGDSNRSDYEAIGMKPFRPYRNKKTTMPYYEVPVSVLEDVDQLAVWGRKAYAVATRAR